MTLNDLERRNSPYFAFFHRFDCFAGQLMMIMIMMSGFVERVINNPQTRYRSQLRHRG